MEICLITREVICTYSVKENLSCYNFNTLLLRTLMGMHFIISYHQCHYLCIHDILFHAHHIGSPEGVTLLEFEEEAEENQETPQTAAPKGEEPDNEELPECPNHRPTSFLKGKPRSIISLLCFFKISLESFMFDALGYKS